LDGNTSKMISPPNSDKIVMWRFLRNRRLILRLHTIFRALIGLYRAHRAVVPAIAWHLVFFQLSVEFVMLVYCLLSV